MGDLIKMTSPFVVPFTFIMAVGLVWGQHLGLILGFFISIGLVPFIYFWGDKCSARLFQGKKIEGQDPWGALQLVKNLSEKAHILPPRVFVVPHRIPQAMALGRTPSKGKIFLTQSLLEKLDKKGLESVLAYQIAAIKRRDTLVHSVSICLCIFLVNTLVLAPLGWLIFKLCIRPQHYLKTDQLATGYLGDSKILATTLWKLNSYAQVQSLDTPWWLSPLFIVAPLTSRSWTRYFSSQPPMKKRIEKLVGHFPI